MRILISGLVLFVIWSLFSVWLYVNHIRPAMIEPVATETISEIPVVEADTIKPPAVVKPDNMVTYFGFDNAMFAPAQQTDDKTAEFKTWLDNNPGSMLSITGHTDYIGTETYNLALGMRRAQAVKEFFTGRGIDPEKIETVSRGEAEPADNSMSDEARAKNRRAVITIKN